MAETKRTKKRQFKATIQTPSFNHSLAVMPVECSDAVADMMTTLSWGFNVGERRADGRREYKRLRELILREQVAKLSLRMRPAMPDAPAGVLVGEIT